MAVMSPVIQTGKLRLKFTRLLGAAWNLLWIKPLFLCLGRGGELALSLEGGPPHPS